VSIACQYFEHQCRQVATTVVLTCYSLLVGTVSKPFWVQCHNWRSLYTFWLFVLLCGIV